MSKYLKAMFAFGCVFRAAETNRAPKKKVQKVKGFAFDKVGQFLSTASHYSDEFISYN